MDNEMDNSEFHEGRESAKEKARSAVDAYKKIYEEDCTKLKELNEKFVKSADTLVDRQRRCIPLKCMLIAST